MSWSRLLAGYNIIWTDQARLQFQNFGWPGRLAWQAGLVAALVRNLFSIFVMGSAQNSVCGTFSSFVKRFITKPLVRNLYSNCPKKVYYETSDTEPLFQLSRYGSVPNLVFYETKKGSYGVPRIRTFLSSVKNLFFLECSFIFNDTMPFHK